MPEPRGDPRRSPHPAPGPDSVPASALPVGRSGPAGPRVFRGHRAETRCGGAEDSGPAL